MGGENVIVRCAGCGQKNRVPLSRLPERPVCARCRAPLSVPPRGVADVRDATFSREVLGAPFPVVVFFYAPWCGHCRNFAPVFERAARDFSGRGAFVRTNIDENPDTSRRYAIRGTPTIMVFRDGREVERLDGAPPPDQFANRIRAALA